MREVHRVSAFLVVGVWAIVFGALALPATAAGTTESLTVVSGAAAGIKVLHFGVEPTGTFPAEPHPGLPAGWNSDTAFDVTAYASAVEGTTSFPFSSPYLDPGSTAPFSSNGATWISIASDGEGPDTDSTTDERDTYLYRVVFELPAGATSISGTAAVAADNYGWLYVNGFEVLGPSVTSDRGTNFESGQESVGSVPSGLVVSGENVLAVEVQNGAQSIAHGPTAALFSIELQYDLSNVVGIDIKPGSDPNSINLGSKGTVPVAILSTAEFDATTVDPATVTLEGAAVASTGSSGKLQASFEDVNGDGLADLVVHIVTKDLELTESSTVAVLEGETFGGTPIEGSDSVRIVPP